jgi:O-antigen/teichoic acid export membrane protein
VRTDAGRTFLLLAAERFLQMLIGVLVLAALARTQPVAGFAAWQVAYSMWVVATQFSGIAGERVMLPRLVREPAEAMPGLLGQMRVAKMVAGAAAAVGLLAWAALSGSPTILALGSMWAVYVLSAEVLSLRQHVCYAHDDFVAPQLARLAAIGCRIVIVGTLFVFDAPVYGYVAAWLIELTVFRFAVSRLSEPFRVAHVRLRAVLPSVVEMLKQGAALAIVAAVTAALPRIDRLVYSQQLPVETLAHSSAAMSVLEALFGVSAILTTVLGAKSLFKVGKVSLAGHVRAGVWSFVAACAMATALTVLAGLLVEAVFGSTFGQSADFLVRAAWVLPLVFVQAVTQAPLIPRANNAFQLAKALLALIAGVAATGLAINSGQVEWISAGAYAGYGTLIACDLWWISRNREMYGEPSLAVPPRNGAQAVDLPAAHGVAASPLLKVGLLVDRPIVSGHVASLVKQFRASASVRIAHVVLLESTPSRRTSGIPGWLAWIEHRLLARFPRFASSLDEVPIERLGLEVLSVSRPPDVDRSEATVTEEDLGQVRALDLDCLVDPISDLRAGTLLGVPRLGTIAVRLDRLPDCSAFPGPFRTVLERRATTAVTVVLRGADRGSERVLRHIAFPTAWFGTLNVALAAEKARGHVELLLESAARTGQLTPCDRGLPYAGRAAAPATASEIARYATKLAWTLLSKGASTLLGVGECWHVALVPSDWRRAAYADGVEIPNPRGHFLADPFLFTRDGRTYCFVEDFSYETHRGCIAAYELKDGRAVPLGPVVREPFHLSFPFLFEHAGTLYMVPESSANRDIRVYRCRGFPDDWVLEKVVMRDVVAADTMIFRRGERWWMLTNLDPSGCGETCTELFLFYADDPLAGEWVPHVANPVVVGANDARNGGLIVEGDRLFRVAQRQGFGVYGAGASIREIVSLSETVYDERHLTSIDGHFRSDIDGTHHLDSRGEWTAFDFVRCREFYR